MARQICIVEDCEKFRAQRGLCRMHAWRLQNHGEVGSAEPMRSREIQHGTVAGYKHRGCRCNPCREARRLSELKWRANNRESYRRTQSAYRALNADKVAEYRRRWKRANPDKVNGTDPARAAAKFDAEAIAYAEMIRVDPCVYCGLPSSEIDHIVPVSVSRSSHWTNLAPICDACNSSKGAKSVLHFMLYRQRTSPTA